MSGSTRRKISIKQNSQDLDALRRLYQLQGEYGIDPSQFLMPFTVNGETIVGWSYFGFDTETRRIMGTRISYQTDNPTALTEEEAFPEGVMVTKQDLWSDSVNRSTSPQNLDIPLDDSVDFYDRLGGALFYDLPSYDRPIYFAGALENMALESITITDRDLQDIRNLDGITVNSRQRLNSMLEVAGQTLFQRQEGIEDYDSISDLNLFIYSNVINRDPNAEFDPSSQGRRFRSQEEANTLFNIIFPNNEEGTLSSLQRMGQVNDQVYRSAGLYLPALLAGDGRSKLGQFILELVTEKYGDNSIEYRLAVQNGVVGEQDIELLPPSTFSSEYYDFVAEAPFFEDYATSVAKNFLNPQNPSVLSFARATPEYNYYSKAYEEAIAGDKIPEPLLPNMYYYKFATEARQRDIALDRDYNQPNYDTLITFDEFNLDVIPLVDSDNFQDYINNIYPGMTNNVSVDLVTQLGEQYYNDTSAGSQMNVYGRLNYLKSSFPMYNEISIPTPRVGDFGQLVENNITSGMFVNALIGDNVNNEVVQVQEKRMRVVSDAYDIGDLFSEDTQQSRNESIIQAYNSGLKLSDIENSFGTYTIPLLYDTEFGPTLPIIEVYDFDAWFENVASSYQQSLQNQAEGRENQGGLSPSIRLQFQGIRNRINQIKNQKMPSYEDSLRGTSCESETIAYRLIKKDPSKNNAIIQNFYFANTTFVDVIDFVDTQVKYEKEYTYELNAFSVVYGSKFTFSTLGYQADFESRIRPRGRNQGRGIQLEYVPPFAKFKLFTEPSVKIVEYPILSPDWLTSNRILNLPEPHGLNIPNITIADEPPMPPEMQIVPYQGNAQNILLNFQVGIGNSQNHEADAPLPFIRMSEADAEDAQKLALYQKSFKHFEIVAPELYFESESETEIKRMEIYRTTQLNLLTDDTQQIYDSFGGTPHKILDISGDPEIAPSEEADSFDFIDLIQPNIKYYYAARSIDVHGHKSNPTTIMVVEIVFENGLVYPTLQQYIPKPLPISNRTKKANRYIEIKAADIQTYVYNQKGQNGGPDISKQGLIEEAQYQVANNDFLVRVISKDTGRRFDLKVSFNKQSREVVGDEVIVNEEGEFVDPQDNDDRDGYGEAPPPGRPPL